MTRRIWLAAGTLALLAGACGDDDDGGGDVSDEAQPYVDAMVTSMQGDEDMPLETEQADCLAPRWVEILDPARLEDAGITPDALAGDDDVSDQVELTEEEGGEMYDAMGDCDVDVRGLIVDSIAEEAELSEEDRECIEGAFSDDFLRRLFAVQLSQGEDALQADEELTSELLAAFSECPGALPDS